MTDAPERVRLRDTSTPQRPGQKPRAWRAFSGHYLGDGVSYTRTDIAETAYSRGLERAAEIAAEWEETLEKRGGNDSEIFAAQKIFKDIRAEIEKPDEAPAPPG